MASFNEASIDIISLDKYKKIKYPYSSYLWQKIANDLEYNGKDNTLPAILQL